MRVYETGPAREPLIIKDYKKLTSFLDVFSHFRKGIVTISENPALVSLPPSISQVKSLQVLRIERNPSFKELPEEIGRLSDQSVIIRDNPELTSVPRSLSGLPAKATVHIEKNYAIPAEEIDALKREQGLTIIRTSSEDIV